MPLTETQEKIIELIVEGNTNAQIAETLCFSVPKIKKDLREIYKYYRIIAPAETKRSILVREVVKTEMTKLMM